MSAPESEIPKSAPKNAPEDDDLDDLLDEFDEQVLSKPPGSQAPSEKPAAAPDTLNTEFKHNIDDLIKDLSIEDPEAKAQFEQLVKQFELSHMEDAARAQDPQNLDDVVKETMARLKKSGETVDEQLKNDPMSSNPEDMLAQLLASMGGAGADGDFDMTKVLSDMLEQLSSKEVIYEPIKDFNAKLPAFLKEKEGKIPQAEHEKYSKQYGVTNEILAVFDAPGYNNENPEHREKVNVLLESLQELGNPPTELVGDAKDFPGFGGLGGLGGLGGDGLDFNSDDIPKDLEKDLEENCKQT